MILAAGPWVFSSAQAASPEKQKTPTSTVVRVTGPRLVGFFPAVTQKEIDKEQSLPEGLNHLEWAVDNTQLLAGKTDVESALKEFHQTVISPLNHPGDLQAWCDLSDGLHPERRNPISTDRRNMLAFQAARALLDQLQSPSA